MPLHQEQPSGPHKCPRCSSFDTKFRYYNNNDRAQPRHYCKTCRRYWTLGGSLRNIPIGGSRRYGKQTQDSSLVHSNPLPPFLPASSTFKEEWQHDSKYPTLMGAVIPQTFDETTYQPHGNLPGTISPSNSFYFNDDIYSLAAIESLTRPLIMNGSFNTGNQFGHGSMDMAIMQGRNFQSMALQQPSLQQISSHGENLIHPSRPMNSLSLDFNNNFSFSASGAGSCD